VNHAYFELDEEIILLYGGDSKSDVFNYWSICDPRTVCSCIIL